MDECVGQDLAKRFPRHIGFINEGPFIFDLIGVQVPVETVQGIVEDLTDRALKVVSGKPSACRRCRVRKQAVGKSGGGGCALRVLTQCEQPCQRTGAICRYGPPIAKNAPIGGVAAAPGRHGPDVVAKWETSAGSKRASRATGRALWSSLR